MQAITVYRLNRGGKSRVRALQQRHQHGIGIIDGIIFYFASKVINSKLGTHAWAGFSGKHLLVFKEDKN